MSCEVLSRPSSIMHKWWLAPHNELRRSSAEPGSLSARRLVRLVNDLLDSSRLSSGQFTLVRETCDVAELAKEVVEQLRPVAPRHTLVIEVPDTPITGNWDGGRLQQALGNLLDNAIKYSDEGTTVTVCIEATQDGAHISVHDQGTTIYSADIGQLF